MEFEIMSYFITSKKNDKDPVFDERLEESQDQTLLSLIEKERATLPVLVFCSEEALASMWEKIPEMIEIKEIETHSDLERVEVKDEFGNCKVFVACAEMNMRGLDFRAPKLGMTLIVNKGFSSKRDMYQGMNRVGRFGDKCKRVKLGKFSVVDPAGEAQLWSKLFAIRDKKLKKGGIFSLKKPKKAP